MDITHAHLRNILLPGADSTDVIAALAQWHAANGFQQVFGRQLFDHRDYYGTEERAFVLSNGKWCVVLHSSYPEYATAPVKAFKDFPAVVQLWAQDSAWGYQLEEHGSIITGYCTKAVDEVPGLPPARQPGDLKRLVAACGVPESLERLRRLEKGRFVFVQKACAEFADALKVPLTTASFYDADAANAGMSEVRQACGWECRMLAFVKSPAAPAVPVEKSWMETLTPEQRAKLVKEHLENQEQVSWWRKALIIVSGLGVALWFTGEIILSIFLSLFMMIPALRPKFVGKATCFSEQFWSQLQPAEPQRIQFRGDLAINTRHRCSIKVPSTVKVLERLRSPKPIPGNEYVFRIESGPLFLCCKAYPNNSKVGYGGEIVEEKSFLIEAGKVDFFRRRSRTKFSQHYQWVVHTPKADYHFETSSEEEINSADYETLDTIVRSFRIEPEVQLEK